MPFRDNGHLSDSQVRYNVVHSAARSVTERAFGRLKGKFRRLKYIDVTHTDLAAVIIDTACVLHNVSLLDTGADDVADKADVVECDISEHNPGQQPRKNSKAQLKRDAIMQSL